MIFQSWFFFLAAATLSMMKLSEVSASTWATIVPMEPLSDQAQIVFDENGNIIEIIKLPFGSNHVIFSSTYKQATNTWAELTQLSTLDEDVRDIRLVYDPLGNAAAVWKISNGLYEKIQAAVYSASKDQWSQTEDLSTMAPILFMTHAAMAESGDVFVAWKELFDQFDVFYTVTFSQSSEKWSRSKSELFLKMETGPISPFLDPKKNAFLNNALNELGVLPHSPMHF